jgi:hypothetical protein
MLLRLEIAKPKCRSGSKISGCGDRLQARSCPFAAADAIVVDLHREPASEKQGVGFFCDGRASLVDGWSASDTHQIPFGTSMGFAKGSTHPTGCAPMIATMISEKTLSQRIIQELL